MAKNFNRVQFGRGMDSFMEFGKYRVEKVKSVLEKGPGYLKWCIDNLKWFTVTDEVEQKLKIKLNKKRSN